jgi:hypothetical protein
VTTESLIALWDRGGSAILILVGVGLLLRYMLGRVVKAFDDLISGQRDATKSQSESFTELTGALLTLTERISRVEGKVEAFGMMAVRGVRPTQAPTSQPDDDHARAVAAVERTIEETFGEEHPTTGVHAIPIQGAKPAARPPKMPTPPKGITFGPGYRAPTKGK